MNQFAGEFQNKLLGFSPEIQQMLGLLPEQDRASALKNLIETRAFGEAFSNLGRQQNTLPTEEELKRFEEFEGRRAQRAQELGMQSMKETAKYGALFKTIPQSIANAFGAQAAIQLAAGGNIANIYAQPNPYRMDVSAPGYNFEPTKYYGNYLG
jgi:hypothetical protein